jgi:hypothetical protein
VYRATIYLFFTEEKLAKKLLFHIILGFLCATLYVHTILHILKQGNLWGIKVHSLNWLWPEQMLKIYGMQRVNIAILVLL